MGAWSSATAPSAPCRVSTTISSAIRTWRSCRVWSPASGPKASKQCSSGNRTGVASPSAGCRKRHQPARSSPISPRRRDSGRVRTRGHAIVASRPPKMWYWVFGEAFSVRSPVSRRLMAPWHALQLPLSPRRPISLVRPTTLTSTARGWPAGAARPDRESELGQQDLPA